MRIDLTFYGTAKIEGDSCVGIDDVVTCVNNQN
jgi:hypothetical protein